MSKKGLGKFVAGAAVGAGLGILFAPKKGTEIRKELKEKIDDLLDKIKSLDKEDIQKEFEQKINEIKKELTLLLILSIVLSALSKTWIDLIPNIVSTTNNIIPIIYNNTCNTKIVVSIFSPFIPRTLNQLNQRD